MLNILNIPLYDKNIHSFISKEILTTCNAANIDKVNRCVSATGAHGIVYAQRNKDFLNILNSFYCNLPDGMPSVWVGKIKGAKDMQRCYGPDFFQETILATKNKAINHFFCGGKIGVAEELKEVCDKRHGNKNIVGTFSPPFREMSDEELKKLADEINGKRTDIVWIGLSTPKQEIFAYRLSKFTKVHFICTVGAAFDFHTGRVKQAPKWMQILGLEWLFRLMIEPKRLWRRYFEIVPLFIWYNIIELLTGKFFNTKGE